MNLRSSLSIWNSAQLNWNLNRIRKKSCWNISVRSFPKMHFWKRLSRVSMTTKPLDNKKSKQIEEWMRFTCVISRKKPSSHGERNFMFNPQNNLQGRLRKHSPSINPIRYYEHSLTVQIDHWHFEDKDIWNWQSDQSQKGCEGWVYICFEQELTEDYQ